jgi:hypothetical protein
MDLSPKSLIAFLKEHGYKLDRIKGTYKGIQKIVITEKK